MAPPASQRGVLALQVAALPAPPASLKGVIAVSATDDRFADDMHFQGGALLCENLSWSAWLQHTLSQPADPLVSGTDGWLEGWRARAAAAVPLAPRWMSHATEGAGDGYWAQGSVKHTYHAISVPMLLVGGMHGGGYHASVPRMAARCSNAAVTAVVGPWSHNMPHTSPLGPQTGFLQDALVWLRSLAAPARGLTVFSEAPALDRPLAAASATLPGRWLHFPGSDAAAGAVKALRFALTTDGALAPVGADDAAQPPAAPGPPMLIDSTIDNILDGGAVAGAAAGRWFTFGNNDDLPMEQSPDDAVSTLFELPPAAEDTLILGAPSVSLCVPDGAACDGHLVARLVAVAPNGLAHRITWGVLHLGKAAAAAAPLRVELKYTCYTLPKGYKLRLALSRDYFPIVWPSVTRGAKPALLIRGGASTLTVHQAPCGADAIAAALDAAAERVTTAVHIPAGSDVSSTARAPGRRTVTNAAGVFKVEICSPHAKVDLGAQAQGLVQESACTETFSLRDIDGVVVPEHQVAWSTTARRMGAAAVDSTCTLTARLTGGPSALELTHHLRTVSGDSVVVEKEWQHRIDAASV